MLMDMNFKNINGYDLSWLNNAVIYIEEGLFFDWREVLNQPNVDSRNTYPMHITASAVITDASNSRMLLVRHLALDKLLQPGGHIENGEIPLGTALREIGEECGISYASILHIEEHPVDVDIHFIPENTSKREEGHWHLDMCFHVQVAGVSDNSELGTEWKSINDCFEGQRLQRLASIVSQRNE